MSNTPQGGGGNKKGPPRTFGDVMKGIPAGQGGKSEREGRGDDKRPEKQARPPERREDKRDEKRRRHQPEEVKKGPVVVRKPPPLTAKKEGEPAAPEAPAQSEVQAEGGAPEPRPAPVPPRRPEPAKKSPKTVFRRADHLNLPPREAEGEQALAPSGPLPEESLPGEDFASMFAESEKQKGGGAKRFEVGQKVSGRIVQIGSDMAFLDLGGKGEGMIGLGELKDSHGDVIVTVGEFLDGYVLATGAEGIIVTKQLTKGAQREFLMEARESGIPVEGLVTGHNKGGLEVDMGGIRGFCPTSQIDIRFVDPATFVGQRLTFKVIEVKDRDIVLSRRAFLEVEQAKKAEETRKHLHVGAQLEGTVTSVRDFGAFVDLGGVEGLIHVSELAYGRVTRPSDVLQAGQTVKVEVVRIDPPKGDDKQERIGLSMKALQQDPWELAASRFHEGDRVTGKVVRLQPFGAFVELMPGVDGLVHISALGANRRINHPSEVVSEGEEVTVVVEGIDREQKRMSLRRITAEEAAGLEAQPAAEGGEKPRAAVSAKPKVGDVHTVTVDKVEQFGLFVSFPGGRGLVPNAEMGTPKGTDHRKQFGPGTTFKAQIVEIDNQGRLRLSKTAAEQAEERADYQQFMQSNKPKGGGGKGFGTLGDLLKGLKK